ncbi:hypothetical protein K0M31_010690, partial [Melipona bicolor]
MGPPRGSSSSRITEKSRRMPVTSGWLASRVIVQLIDQGSGWSLRPGSSCIDRH